MSHYDYEVSQKISANDPPFYALIMAGFRRADPKDCKKLREAFPRAWHEWCERFHTPRGLTHEELKEHFAAELPKTLLGRKVMIMDASPTHVNLVLGDWSIPKKERHQGMRKVHKHLFGPAFPGVWDGTMWDDEEELDETSGY